MERHFMRRLCALCLLALLWLTALPAAADSGDYDRIDDYVVTVDLREDGSADITYQIDWQVIGGGADDYLSWVRIGLANLHIDEVQILTPDTVSGIELVDEGGAYAQVSFDQPYYAPDVAARNGGESEVNFAFSVHQSHLFTLNGDGTASFVFTPGWFDELNVERLTVRWRAYDGFAADNTDRDGDYLTWVFGPLAHGEAATVHVNVPVTAAQNYDADAVAEPTPAYRDETVETIVFLLIILAVALLLLYLIYAMRRARWYGGFGCGLRASDWLWYTNGVHTIRRARTAPPPAGYHPTSPPANFRAGGGRFRGGGAGRNAGGHSGGCASSCACACASSCACACACAGGGRAGCSAKELYRIRTPELTWEEETR